MIRQSCQKLLIFCFCVVLGTSSALAITPDDQVSSNSSNNNKSKAREEVILGDSYFTAKEFDKSIRCYQKALASVPSQANLHFKLACAAWNANDMKLASEHYSTAIQLGTSSAAECHFGLGLCQEKMKNTGAAIAAFKQCTVLKKDFPAAWLHLGRSYELVADTVNAKNAYLMCISFSSTSAATADEAKEAIKNLKSK